MAKVPKKLATISDITKLGDSFARTLRANYKWSRKLRNAVKLHKGEDKNGNLSIMVTVGEGDDNLQGMARAFEYGSGERGRRGSKYPIVPKHANALSFPGTNDFEGTQVVTKLVMHPGVVPKGNIQKTVASVRGRMAQELKATIRKNIIDNIRVTIAEANKK